MYYVPGTVLGLAVQSKTHSPYLQQVCSHAGHRYWAITRESIILKDKCRVLWGHIARDLIMWQGTSPDPTFALSFIPTTGLGVLFSFPSEMPWEVFMPHFTSRLGRKKCSFLSHLSIWCGSCPRPHSGSSRVCFWTERADPDCGQQWRVDSGEGWTVKKTKAGDTAWRHRSRKPREGMV